MKDRQTKRKVQFIVLSAVAVLITAGCTVTWGTPEPVEPMDHSFSVTGNTAETGTIASVLERRGLFTKRRAPPEADILLEGRIRTVGFFTVALPQRMYLNYNHDNVLQILSTTRHAFRWDGTVTMNGKTEDISVSFFAYGNARGK